ncbi:MAG: GNAT family N-acetyltransferase [Acidimicrobiaceae bacterium]|nr:GNAT family N-acetyltransferase [Acidimicrobiaceae bacterium]
MAPVRRAFVHDASALSRRVASHLARAHHLNSLINPEIDEKEMASTFARVAADTWVDDSGGALHGHLSARLLDDEEEAGLNAFSGPDAVSFDSVGVLARLLESARPTWRSRSVRQHSVWSTLDDHRAWTGLGYEPVAVSLACSQLPESVASRPGDVTVLRAAPHNLATLVNLDAEIDRAQGEQVDESSATRLAELLIDPDVTYLVASRGGEIVGQVVAWDLGALVGYYAHTLHFSDLAVAPTARRSGVASLLLRRAVEMSPTPVTNLEARTHTTNLGASAFWSRLGFTTAFVRLDHTFD